MPRGTFDGGFISRQRVSEIHDRRSTELSMTVGQLAIPQETVQVGRHGVDPPVGEWNFESLIEFNAFARRF